MLQVRAALEFFGAVIHVVCPDPSKPYVFATFADPLCATEAREALNQSVSLTRPHPTSHLSTPTLARAADAVRVVYTPQRFLQSSLVFDTVSTPAPSALAHGQGFRASHAQSSWFWSG